VALRLKLRLSGPRPFGRLLYPLAAVLISLAAAASPGAAQPGPSCPSFPPVPYLTGVSFYTDVRGSVASPTLVQQNEASRAPVEGFMRYAEQALDTGGSNRNAIACAHDAFEAWARAGALTKKPPAFNRQGIIDTHQFTIGLNVLALKFKAAGYPPDANVMQWLRTLNDQEIQYFRSSPNRGNLYFWSGAAVALFAPLSHDRPAIDYQNRVWSDTTSSIGEHGTLESEMVRGRMSLSYHMYAFSALLVQRAARQALGYPTSASDMARLQSLAGLIGRALCDPRNMQTAAHAETMITPKDWAFRVPVAFGRDMLTPDWKRCGISNPSGADVSVGGNDERTSALLGHVSR
jgi:hypothetical protein